MARATQQLDDALEGILVVIENEDPIRLFHTGPPQARTAFSPTRKVDAERDRAITREKWQKSRPATRARRDSCTCERQL